MIIEKLNISLTLVLLLDSLFDISYIEYEKKCSQASTSLSTSNKLVKKKSQITIEIVTIVNLLVNERTNQR